MIDSKPAAATAIALPPFPAPLRSLISRLPIAPPSLLLAALLNRLWWPRVDAHTQAALYGRVVELCVDDVGLRCRLIAEQRGLRAATGGAEPALRLRASSQVYWRLLQGQDDPDTLFFERALVIEGDTEFGLLVKNTLDAVGPPRWSHWSAR